MPEEYWGPYTGQHDKIVLSGDPQHDVRRRFLTRCDDASDIANVTTVIGGSKDNVADDEEDDKSQDANNLDDGVDMNQCNAESGSKDPRHTDKGNTRTAPDKDNSGSSTGTETDKGNGGSSTGTATERNFGDGGSHGQDRGYNHVKLYRMR